MTKRFFICFSATLLLLLGRNALAQSIPTTVVVAVMPDAPSDLAADSLAPTQVELTWTNNAADADWVSIERKTGLSGIYAEIATTSPDLATYVDDTVSPATTYFYRVSTVEDAVYSAYSNEVSLTTPSIHAPPVAPVSVGGGGTYIPPAPTVQTKVILSGLAYPSSQVFILKDGQLVLQTVAGPDANFTANIDGLSGGNYDFSVYSEDTAGNRSAAFTFSVGIKTGATTMVSGIFLSPTISVDKQEVKRGDTITIFGESIPDASVSIEIDADRPVFVNTNSNQSGAYLYEFDTAPLALNSYSAKSKAASGTALSADSISAGFVVGTQNIAGATPACPPNFPEGDLNHDCRVNLIDFSILAYRYGKSSAPSTDLLDGAPMVDLKDFSIMAYYWTG